MMSRLRFSLALMGAVGLLGSASCSGDVGDATQAGGGQGQGGGGYQGEGGAQSGGGPAGLEAAVQDVTNGPHDGPVACDGADPSALSSSEHRPRSRGGFASAQYARAALASGHWPDPTVLREADFQRYFGDRVPVAQGAQLDARLHAKPTSDGSTALDVSVRLAPPAAAPPVHLIVVADVSESASASLEARNGALDAIAHAVDAHPDDTLSLVVFASPAEVLIDRAPQGKAFATLEETRAELYARPSSDLIGGISLAIGLSAGGEATHLLVITDGGTKWDDSIRDLVEEASEHGVVTSVAQIAKSGSDATPTLNDALLQGIAEAGMGTRLYFGDAEARAVFEGRYGEVTSIASSSATLSLTLPAGLDLVGGEQGDVLGRPIGYARRIGTEVVASPGCADVFGASQTATLSVAVMDGNGDVLANGNVPLAYADAVDVNSDGSLLEGAIAKVVVALRSRDASALDAAHAALLSIEGCVAGDCSVADACCVRDELLSMIESTCPLFAQTIPPQLCGAL